MRTVGVVTVGRSDYTIYRPVLRRIQSDGELALRIVAAGSHLSPRFGMTADVIEEDGFRIDERVETLVSSDTPEGIAKSIGLGAIGFSQVFARNRPDVLLVLGDRYEMLAAVVAALPFKIPVAHIHGGELTEGAIDDSVRHSITKMAHLHFASTDAYAERIVQMGEEPWRVTVSGAPALDAIADFDLMSREELAATYKFDLRVPTLLATYHPVTLEYESTESQMSEFLGALDDARMPVIFTYPNADTANHAIATMKHKFVADHSDAMMVANMGTDRYFSMMSHACAMVGNSSSGIIEAASFELPVVNVGNRQRGRIRPGNVIDVECRREAILDGICTATSTQFRDSLRGLANPCGDGHAAERIVERLKTVCLDDRLLVKRFYDMPAPMPSEVR